MKNNNHIRHLLLLSLVLSSVSFLFHSQNVSAWDIQISENYIAEQGSGQANARVVMIIDGKDNSTHTIKFGFFIIGNGAVNEISITSVNMQVYRNSTFLKNINLSPSKIATYCNEFSAEIFYNSNISLVGSMNTKFMVDGVEKTIEFDIVFSYLTPAPPAPSIPSSPLFIILSVICLSIISLSGKIKDKIKIK